MPVMSETTRVAAEARVTTGVSYAIARLQQRVFAGVNERVTPYGLTTLQFTTLSVLNRQVQPLSTAQLARRRTDNATVDGRGHPRARVQGIDRAQSPSEPPRLPGR